MRSSYYTHVCASPTHPPTHSSSSLTLSAKVWAMLPYTRWTSCSSNSFSSRCRGDSTTCNGDKVKARVLAAGAAAAGALLEEEGKTKAFTVVVGKRRRRRAAADVQKMTAAGGAARLRLLLLLGAMDACGAPLMGLFGGCWWVGQWREGGGWCGGVVPGTHIQKERRKKGGRRRALGLWPDWVACKSTRKNTAPPGGPEQPQHCGGNDDARVGVVRVALAVVGACLRVRIRPSFSSPPRRRPMRPSLRLSLSHSDMPTTTLAWPRAPPSCTPCMRRDPRFFPCRPPRRPVDPFPPLPSREEDGEDGEEEGPLLLCSFACLLCCCCCPPTPSAGHVHHPPSSPVHLPLWT